MQKSVNILGSFPLLLKNPSDVRVDREHHSHYDVHHYAKNELSELVNVASGVVDCLHYESTNYAIQEIF